MHELEYGLRASLVALYRGLRDRGRVAGEELEHLLRGDGPQVVRHAWRPDWSGSSRSWSSSASTGICRPWRSPGRRRPSWSVRRRTGPMQQRYEDGRRFLSSANPAERAEPDAASSRRAPCGRRARCSRRSTAAAVGGPIAAAPRSGGSRRVRPPVDAVADARPSAAVDRVELDRRSSEGCSATCSRSSRSTPTRRRSRSTASASRRRSSTPACTTPTSAGAPARTSSSIRSAWRRSAPACGSTPRRCARRCCTTPSRTRRRRSRRSQEAFGEEIAGLVDGVTKLTGLTFQSRDEAQAENYRKMMVAMATDIRVILIKLADRLHNMRTIDAMPKQKQIEKARETLDIYAPIAHRLGIHAIKWELEDLAFQTLHPRKYNEIKGLVAQQRAERERYVNQAGEYLSKELDELGIQAEISGRAKHFYSIYSKMTKKGREFNEIYDLTAMRVIVGSVKDCYGAVGRDPLAVEAAARALQGLHRDAEVQHVPVAAHDRDRARGAAARDPDPHARDARPGRVRDRRPLDVQGGRRAERRAARCATPTASSSGCARCWTGSRTCPTRASSWRRSRSTCSRTRCSCSRPRARSSRSPPARRRWTSPTRSTPTSATAASAPRSTARSCRCPTSCARATSSRS